MTTDDILLSSGGLCIATQGPPIGTDSRLGATTLDVQVGGSVIVAAVIVLDPYLPILGKQLGRQRRLVNHSPVGQDLLPGGTR